MEWTCGFLEITETSCADAFEMAWAVLSTSLNKHLQYVPGICHSQVPQQSVCQLIL